MKTSFMVVMAVAVAVLSSTCIADEMIDAVPISHSDERLDTGAESMFLLQRLAPNVTDTRLSRKAPSVVRRCHVEKDIFVRLWLIERSRFLFPVAWTYIPIANGSTLWRWIPNAECRSILASRTGLFGRWNSTDYRRYCRCHRNCNFHHRDLACYLQYYSIYIWCSLEYWWLIVNNHVIRCRSATCWSSFTRTSTISTIAVSFSRTLSSSGTNVR